MPSNPTGIISTNGIPTTRTATSTRSNSGFEFGDLAYGASEPGYAVVGSDLNRYTTTGGVKKQARYRATWPRRSAAPQEINDYTNIYRLVETTLTNAPIGSEAYTLALSTEESSFFFMGGGCVV